MSTKGFARTVAAIAATGMLATASAASATEYILSNNPTPASETGSTTGPLVWLIGDSLTNDVGGVQTNYDAWYFALAGWRTRIEATLGSNMAMHWQTKPLWNTFVRARADSRTKVIFVELGTNDTSSIWPGASNYTTERQKTLNHLALTTQYLRDSKRCVVFMGVDASGNGAISTTMGADYNKQLKTNATGNVHFADYHSLITTNAKFRAGVYVANNADKVHPKTNAAKEILAIWLRDQIRWHCRI